MTGSSNDIGDSKQALEKVRESLERYRNLFDHASEGLLVMTTEGRIVQVNQAFATMHGYSPEQLTTMTIMDLDAWHDRALAGRAPTIEAMKNGHVARFEAEHKHADGHIFPVAITTSLIHLDGAPHFVAFHQDISEKKVAERQLVESERKYRSLFENASIPMLQTSLATGEILDVNAKLAEMYGGTREELIGQKAIVLYADPAERAELLRRLQQDVAVSGLEFRAVTKQGALRNCLLSVQLYPERNLIEGSIIDITERKAIEEALRRSEERYRSLFESMNEGFCLHELLVDGRGIPYDYVILDANPAFENIIGMHAKDVVGKRATVAYGVAVPPYLEVYAAVALSGTPTRFETHFAPMAKHFAITVFSPAKGRFATIFEDITARKRDEEALRQSQERFRSIVQNTEAGYFFIDKLGIIKDVNPAWVKLYGYESPDDVVGHHFVEIQKLEDVESARTFVEGIMKGDSRYCSGEFSRKRRDGSIGYHFFAARPVDIAGETVGIEGFMVDSTAQKTAEDALQKREEKYRNLFNNAEVGMFRSRLDGSEMLEINDTYLRILGRTREEMIGKPAEGLWADPVARLEIAALLKTDGYVSNIECRLLRKDGSIADCISSVRLYPEEGVIEGTVMDITERKRMEEALHNAQRLESLGLLAGGIAHDFNNLLHGTYAYVELASETAMDPDTKAYLAKATSTIERGRDLTRQLITFAKGGTPVRVVGHLFPLVREAAQFALSGSDVSCTFEVPDDVWPADYDKNQIGQVIDNVVINAKQAMPCGGRIDIAARNLPLAKGEHPGLDAGNYVKLSIRDQGIGIPKEMLPKIFDPFFTTKPAGHGLGLATCYSILKRHGGAIEVESEMGKGSTFHIFLPAAATPVAPSTTKVSAPFKGSGMFVVMDDQAVVRDTTRMVLQSLGFEVVCMEDGKRAVEFIAKTVGSGGTIAGAIFDLTVPGGMGGKDALQTIRALGIELPVIAASGHAEDPVMAKPCDFGFVGSLAKPFTKAQLVASLEKLTLRSADRLQ